MAGVKGRSGRKSTSQEEKRLAIIDKAWEIVGTLLNDPNADFYYKLQYASDIVKRSIPQAPLIDQSKHIHHTVIWEIDGNKIQAPQKSGERLDRQIKV